jgi:ATP-binding cassette subfamily F protein 2
LKKFEKEQEDIKSIKQFIASCGTYANLVKQAKSKQKILDKMYADGLTEKPSEPPKFNFAFSQCAILPPPVLQFHNVGFAYSGKDEDLLYTGVNLAVDMDSRVALVGPNGAGKSTLLKLMLNQIKPTYGDIKSHLDMRLGHYHQHSTEILPPDQTPLEYFMAKFPEQKLDEEAWRGVIGRYGISGKMQKQKMGAMSDGQKARVVFCLLANEKPNILLLDEPTNHLDMQCIDALADAIRKFTGGVVLVSHDFRLISQVAKEIWLCDNGVTTFPGDIRSYKKMLTAQVQKSEADFKGGMSASR